MYPQDYNRRIIDRVERLHIYGPVEAAVDDPIEISPLHTLAWTLILGIRESTRIIWSSVPAIDIEDSGLYRSARCTLLVADSATGSMRSRLRSLNIEPIAQSRVNDSEVVEDSRKHVGL